MTSTHRAALLNTALAAFAALAASAPALADNFDPGTEADREALFDQLLEKTLAYDAFASLDEHPYHQGHPKGIDVAAEISQYRDTLIAADTDEKLWFALQKISNARRDRHLAVRTVDDGLQLSQSQRTRLEAPIRFAVDYSDPDDYFFFVSDMPSNIADHVDTDAEPQHGDRLLAINHTPIDQYVRDIRPFQRYSTELNFWWRLAEQLNQTVPWVPHDRFYDPDLQTLHLELQRPDDTTYQLELPYRSRGQTDWQDLGQPRYPGFSPIEHMSGHDTYNLYRPDDDSLPLILLDWYGFRRDLPQAIDQLVEYAHDNDLLEHHIIIDATRSRGGSNGAYALARLQSQPFRTTFGNLKISDLSENWVQQRLERWDRNPPSHSPGQSSAYVHQWLKNHVSPAIDAGKRYTNDVPFKGVLPPWADGIIEPAPEHFRGKLVVWLSPRGGSHLDQFAAQIVDNDLGHVIGMPAGGFSNKWSDSQTLRMPNTDQPIASFEWSMGHSIRPNGQILQYNPAQPHQLIPQTRVNILDYHPELLQQSLEHLDLHQH